MNTFCADILVPKPGDGWGKAQPDGSRLVCVQTGDAGTTEAESLAKACYSAGVFYVRDPDGPRYPYAIVQVFECCGACNGAGKTPIKRRIYAWRPCKACKERGTWPVGEPARVGDGS